MLPDTDNVYGGQVFEDGSKVHPIATKSSRDSSTYLTVNAYFHPGDPLRVDMSPALVLRVIPTSLKGRCTARQSEPPTTSVSVTCRTETAQELSRCVATVYWSFTWCRGPTTDITIPEESSTYTSCLLPRTTSG